MGSYEEMVDHARVQAVAESFAERGGRIRSWPASRSGNRARPTTCASSISRRKHARGEDVRHLVRILSVRKATSGYIPAAGL
jgi:hypothetical protein